MYLASTVLKHFENQGRRASDLPLVEWSVRMLMYHAQEQLHSFLRNFPNRPVAFVLRSIIFPRGRTYYAPADDLGKKVVELITTTGEARERLSQQAYTTLEPTNPLGLLQEALELSENLAPLEKKLKQAKREGLIQADYFGHQIDEAEGAEVISAAETRELRTFHEKVLHLLSVDDFSPEELGRTGSNSASPTVPAADTVAVPRVQNSEPGSKAKKPAVEKAPGKKPAKRAAAKKSSRKKAASKKKNAKKK
jgi:acyl-CoA dehydrogenase